MKHAFGWLSGEMAKKKVFESRFSFLSFLLGMEIAVLTFNKIGIHHPLWGGLEFTTCTDFIMMMLYV